MYSGKEHHLADWPAQKKACKAAPNETADNARAEK